MLVIYFYNLNLIFLGGYIMAKKGKTNILGYLYLLGLALVVIGFFCPMFKAGPIKPNGWDFLNFENFGFVTIGGLLVLAGAAAGIILSFVGGKNSGFLKLICLIASIVGGIVLVIGFNDNKLYSVIGKGIIKHAFIGFYLVVSGWVVALIGHFAK